MFILAMAAETANSKVRNAKPRDIRVFLSLITCAQAHQSRDSVKGKLHGQQPIIGQNTDKHSVGCHRFWQCLQTRYIRIGMLAANRVSNLNTTLRTVDD
jgi:hypothetical protein